MAHTIHLLYNSMVLSIIPELQNQYRNQFQNIHHPERKPSAHQLSSPSSPLSPLKQAIITIFAYSYTRYSTIHVKLLPCHIMLLKFIQVIVHISCHFYYPIILSCINIKCLVYSFIHQSLGSVLEFWLSHGAAVNICYPVYKFHLDIRTAVELLGQMVAYIQPFEKLPSCFPN